MKKSWYDITIALAGMLQALNSIEQLAKTGYLNSALFKTAMNSLFQFNPSSAEAVFGEISQISPGLDLVEDLFSNHRDSRNSNILRYLIGVLHLQKKLSRRPAVLQIISSRLENAKQQAEHFEAMHDNVVSNLADIYTDTLSKFQYRIQVTGDSNYLQQARVANQVRALLLATIRATTLWRQCGGSRWQLLFYRKKIVETALELKKRID